MRTLLIANRGEICCRIAATARRLGIGTVAVYSDADARSAHVGACARALYLGPSPAPQSYLNIERILSAAREAGADAIHPGYGFLSENAAFARACADAGLVFVGPPSAAIDAMGDKRRAKQLMRRAGVPVIPGFDADDESSQQDDVLRAQAVRLGFPIMIKAAAGGGGRGIRAVAAPAQFDQALAACRREALAAFGDGRLLLERCLTDPRHIEVQVFADAHGGCVWLGERDCSTQRRHQKLIEEAPAFGLSSAQRERLGQAAVAGARAVGYVGAGTVEFLMAPDGEFFFMEMNTRLQVEHPVTEMVTGLDLVEWQLRVAAGQTLPLRQEQIGLHGHAIEARLYAEDPDHDFLPTSGTIKHLSMPPHVAFRTGDGGAGGEPAGVRVDAAVRAGDTITTHYDGLIAKLIAWGQDREQAIFRLNHALQDTRIVGVATNTAFLLGLAASGTFRDAKLDTGWIERQAPALGAGAVATRGRDPRAVALAVAWLLREEAATEGADAWSNRGGWRLNGYAVRRFTMLEGALRHEVTVEYRRDVPHVSIGSWRMPLRVGQVDGNRLQVLLGTQSCRADVVRAGTALHVFFEGEHRQLLLFDPMAGGAAEAQEDSLRAPMPGRIIAVHAAAGDSVVRGQALVVMEAMKMEYVITAPHDGVVQQIDCRVGEAVAEGARLVSL